MYSGVFSQMEIKLPATNLKSIAKTFLICAQKLTEKPLKVFSLSLAIKNVASFPGSHVGSHDSLGMRPVRNDAIVFNFTCSSEVVTSVLELDFHHLQLP